MKIEIRIIDDIVHENGRLLEIVEAKATDYERTQEIAVSSMIRHAASIFGADNYEAVTDRSLFGGYYRNKANGDCIVAR